MTAGRRGTRLTEGEFKFSFDGREVVARRGDSVSAALLASGQRLMGRSVKYRRARGAFSAGIEEPNALFTVGTKPCVIPNVPGPVLAARDGLIVRSQNRWPSLRHDLSALLQLGGGFFGAGFYYKTFMWPSWHSYEGIIRRLAGLGEAPGASNLAPVDVEHLHADVLVAGAGPAGLAAALEASRLGASVVVCEREPMCGGELEFETAGFGASQSGLAWVSHSLEELGKRNVRVLTDTAVVGGSGGMMIAHSQRGGLAGADRVYRIRARAHIAAAGAIERPIAFVNNDLPGVMLLGAAERYLARYGVRVAQSAVLFGNHDRLYSAAARLLSGGMKIRAIVDVRDEKAAGNSADAREALRRAGLQCHLGHAVIAARGRLAVRGVTMASLAKPNEFQDIPCDAVLVSGGWSPALRSAHQQPLGSSCGACDGAFELSEVLSAGHAAGAAASAVAAGAAAAAAAKRATAGNEHAAVSPAGARPGAVESGPPSGRGDPAPAMVPFWRSPSTLSAEKYQFVDLQNDVTVADLRQALEEGFSDIEHVKRYTTLGVGTEQGRTSGVLGAAIVAELSGSEPTTVGTSRARQPYQPVTMMSLVGSRSGMSMRPLRRTPLHEWHESHGGVLEPAGLWMRPRYYVANGTDAFKAGVAEATRVREFGGIVDGSTLGKIEVVGPDAAAFLDSVYLTSASTIKLGRSKYMVNLREDGMVLDDGIVLRLAEDRFLATVSSGHAGHMLSHFEFWRDTVQTPHAVTLTDVTEAWAVIVVAGPQSREKLLDVLGAPWRESLAALTHMAFTEGSWNGRALRILRASFSGELAFELHCRPAIVLELWQRLVAAGLSPYGLEAMDILRVEKGYLVSSEINGQTTPMDLSMDGVMKSKHHCVGRALLDREAFHEPQRPRLVGLQTVDVSARFLAGAQITTTDAAATPMPGAVSTQARGVPSVGHVTSTVFSPALGRWIGLALVGRNVSALGTELMARDPLRNLETRVVVTPLVHFDPSGDRMRT